MSAQPVLTNAGPADPFTEFKAKQREGWALFAPVEAMTTPPAARLVAFAEVKPGQKVLDVGCGTGVAALTAHRAGATVTGLDLTPELLARAAENTAIAGAKGVTWKEGDAEALPFGDAQFDVVLSQYGHMFAPRADVAAREMLRVLKPGGRIAFSTWPPESVTGRVFGLVGRHLPPPPGVTPPPAWGDPAFIRERLGTAVRGLEFDRGTLLWPALSLPHYRMGFETGVAPVMRIVQMYKDDPAKLVAFRQEFDATVAPYFKDNIVRQDFLMTRATKNA